MIQNEQTAELRNKVSELKQRLNRIYAQYFTDTEKGRVFETEFLLYLKACEHPRHEIAENRRLQSDVTRTGLAVLLALSAAVIYLFKTNAFFGAAILMAFGFLACGFMYVLLTAEIRIARASEFCGELETYFQRHRWSTELKESLNLPDIPLWEEFASKWERDMFYDGHFEKKALYGPFRIAITLIALSSLFCLVQSFVSLDIRLTAPILLMLCIILWTAAAALQTLIVDTIVNRVDVRLQRGEKYTPTDPIRGRINRQPRAWKRLLSLFLLLDILFPSLLKKV